MSEEIKNLVAKWNKVQFYTDDLNLEEIEAIGDGMQDLLDKLESDLFYNHEPTLDMYKQLTTAKQRIEKFMEENQKLNQEVDQLREVVKQMKYSLENIAAIQTGTTDDNFVLRECGNGLSFLNKYEAEKIRQALTPPTTEESS